MAEEKPVEKPAEKREGIKAGEVAKILVYVAVPIGALVVIYKILEMWFMGPINAIKDLWKQQYDDYVSELKSYVEEDKGALTPEHQTILDRKTNVMQQTEATFTELAKSPWDLLTLAVEIGGVVLAVYLAPTIIKKWMDLAKGKAATAKGMSYIAVCSMADDLASKGRLVEATALATTMQTRFYNIDLPFMQSQISYYQSLLPTLTGWQLLYAHFLIQTYTLEISSIPFFFSQLPPIIPLKLRQPTKQVSTMALQQAVKQYEARS